MSHGTDGPATHTYTAPIDCLANALAAAGLVGAFVDYLGLGENTVRERCVHLGLRHSGTLTQEEKELLECYGILEEVSPHA